MVMTTTPIARTRSSHTRLLFVCSKDELKKARIALSKELALTKKAHAETKKAHAETKRSLEELKQAVYDQGCQLATMQAEQAKAKKAAAPAAAAPAAPAPALTGKRGPPQPVSFGSK